MTVELVTTSSPEIVEAMERRLYRRAGFELRETNVYRYAQA